MTDIVERLRAEEWRGPMQHCRAWSELDALHDEAAAEIERLRQQRGSWEDDARIWQAGEARAKAEIERLRRIPAHYGAPVDDPDAAIEWITGTMNDETRHLRAEIERLRAALQTIEVISSDERTRILATSALDNTP